MFADGHVVSIYWENISRSIVERTHRDAKKLDVPLYCLQAADQRASYKNKKHDNIVTHSLLTVPNIHNTGKLPGILLVHIGMIVRLSDVMAPRLGLVKDKLGKVLSVVLHERDQIRLNNLPAGYRLFVPEFMAKRYLGAAAELQALATVCTHHAGCRASTPWRRDRGRQSRPVDGGLCSVH